MPCLYGPTSGATNNNTAPNNLLDAPVVSALPPTTAVNVAVTGNRASFLQHTASGASWVFATLNGAAAPAPGVPEQLTTNNAPMGQAWSSGFMMTTRVNGTEPQIFLRDGSVPTQGNLGTNNDKGVPALASASEGYVGRGDALVRFSPAAPQWSLQNRPLAVSSKPANEVEAGLVHSATSDSVCT